MLTITITTDSEGRITGLVVPEGTQAQIVPDVAAADAFAARYGAPGELFFGYDEDRDAGRAPHVPGYFRSRQGMTVHELTATATA
jgi:hypothetical protein